MEKEKIKKMTRAEMDKALIDNFISLQKVLTNLSVKFDDMSHKIEKLLEVFEISAKSFAEKYPEGLMERSGVDVDSEFLRKLNALLDQNKTIAKGIMMMEEKIKNKPTQQPMQQFSAPIPQLSEEDYTRSRY